MDIITIGLDLAKSVFQVHAVDGEGSVVVRKALHRLADRLGESCQPNARASLWDADGAFRERVSS